MAEFLPEERMQLRRMIDDAVEPYHYDDVAIDEMLTATAGDVRAAASTFWYQKAASYSEMVDITEAGSSRKNSALFTNAMSLAQKFDDSDGVNDPTPVPSSTTRQIVRR